MDIDKKDEIEIIREVFTYIRHFRNKIFVFKIEYDVIENPYFPVFLKDLATLHNAGIRVVVVPGARKRIDEILEQYGVPTTYENGIRITGEDAIPFVKMAAFDVSNKIMTGLSGFKINALVGNWIRARSLGVIGGVDYMFSGTVDKVLTQPLSRVLDDEFIPIIPSIGWNTVGTPYNMSSDELAINVAAATGAEKLFFITSEAVLKADEFQIPDNVSISNDGRISRMDELAAADFIALNDGAGERLSLVKKALSGIKMGIQRVHIINGNGTGGVLSEIFSNQGTGTMIYRNEFDRIREMESNDIPEVLRIMQPFEKEGALVPRNRQMLQAMLGDFVVYEVDGVIHGCAALHIYDAGTGEIAAVAVDQEYERLGIGKKLIRYLISQAEKRGIRSLFILTTRSGDWFESLGFRQADLDSLPEEKLRKYDYRRNSKVMILELNDKAGGNN